MYNTKRQEQKIIKTMTEPERKKPKKSEKQLFVVKKGNKKSKRK